MAIDVETIMGVMGNVLEWYDFAVYGKIMLHLCTVACCWGMVIVVSSYHFSGYFGDVIAKVFFPPASDSTGLIWSYAVFGG